MHTPSPPSYFIYPSGLPQPYSPKNLGHLFSVCSLWGDTFHSSWDLLSCEFNKDNNPGMTVLVTLHGHVIPGCYFLPIVPSGLILVSGLIHVSQRELVLFPLSGVWSYFLAVWLSSFLSRSHLGFRLVIHSLSLWVKPCQVHPSLTSNNIM